MSITSSIMSIFSGGNNAQQPAAPQSQQAPQNTSQAPGQTPPQQQAPATSTPPAPSADPLDQFKDLWAAPKDGEGAPQNFDPTKMFNIEPEQFQKSVSSINFTNAVTPEQLARITAGGDDAVKANLEVMNTIAQQSFAQAMLGASKLVESALTQADSHLDRRIESRTKQLQVRGSLRDANPALSHPAAAPLVTALEQQFAAKYPQASAAEITKLATDYLANFAQVASGKPSAQDQQTNTGTDWEKFLSGN